MATFWDDVTPENAERIRSAKQFDFELVIEEDSKPLSKPEICYK